MRVEAPYYSSCPYKGHSRELPRPAPSTMAGCRKETVICEPGHGLSPDTKSAFTLASLQSCEKEMFV